MKATLTTINKVTAVVNNLIIDSGMMDSEDMEGMVYQDEDGNLIMYGDQMMGSDDEDADHEGGHHEMMGDSYGMEGSPGDEVKLFPFI